MNSFVDEVLTGDPKYTLTYNDNTQATNVQIALSTPVQTQGTALNKAFFDSIKTDLTNLNTNKLNVSNKATQAEVIAGTNDTKYITPLALNGKINKINVTGSCTTITAPPHNTDVFDFTQYANKTILITGTMTATNSGDQANYCRMRLYNGTTNYQVCSVEYNEKATSFFMYVDNKYKIIKVEFLKGYTATTTASGITVDTHFYKLPDLQKINMVYNGTNTTYNLQFFVLD